MDQSEQLPDISMNADALWQEEVFTDNRVGSIRKLTPVTASGEADPAREVQYVGSTQVMTPAGALPLSFEIPAGSLAEAAEGFGEAARVHGHLG